MSMVTSDNGRCYGWNFPQKILKFEDIEVLSPSTCECDLMWKQDLRI